MVKVFAQMRKNKKVQNDPVLQVKADEQRDVKMNMRRRGRVSYDSIDSGVYRSPCFCYSSRRPCVVSHKKSRMLLTQTRAVTLPIHLCAGFVTSLTRIGFLLVPLIVVRSTRRTGISARCCIWEGMAGSAPEAPGSFDRAAGGVRRSVMMLIIDWKAKLIQILAA